MVNTRGAADVPLLDLASYQNAGVAAISQAVGFLAARGTQISVLDAGRGQARLLNLIGWDVNNLHEYADSPGWYGDQALHLALHVAMANRLGTASAQALLAGEAVASAADLYLVGKLSQAGLETSFLEDTLESYTAYYEMYGQPLEDLESLLRQAVEDPYGAMLDLAIFLYKTCLPLLAAKNRSAQAAQLSRAAQDARYPLLHHYNISNWILILRNKAPLHPGPQDPALDFLEHRLTGGEHQLHAMLA